MPAPAPEILRTHPQYEPVFHWAGWEAKQQYTRRLAMAEAMWALRHKGPVHDTQNAPEKLRRRMIAMGSLTAKQMTKLGLSVMLKEMAGQSDERGPSRPFIGRECHGKRTRHLWAFPSIAFPPDPYALARAHSEGVAAPPAVVEDPIATVKALSAALRLKEESEQETVLSPLLNGHGPEPVETVALPGPVAVQEPERERVDAVARVATSVPAVLVSGDESLAEKALLLMRLAGEVYTESLVRSAVATVQTAAEPVAEPDRDEQAERLGAAMEEIRRLRKRMQDERLTVEKAQASAAAAQAALTGERARREMAEANLAAIAKGDRVPDESGFRELRKTMQEKPRENARVPVSA